LNESLIKFFIIKVKKFQTLRHQHTVNIFADNELENEAKEPRQSLFFKTLTTD